MVNKQNLTSAMEICGGILIVYGVNIFSFALSVIVAGILLIVAGSFIK